MRSSIAGALAAPGFTAPAWVDGAFALGYIADGSLVWGMEYGAKSAEEAAPKALQTCQHQQTGSDCAESRLELIGNGARLALAHDPGRALSASPVRRRCQSAADELANQSGDPPAVRAAARPGRSRRSEHLRGRRCEQRQLRQCTKS